MPRFKSRYTKNGYIRKGGTVEMYGATANNWIAHKMCDDVDTIKQAEAKVRSVSGPMQEAVIAVLDGKYFDDAKGNPVKFHVDHDQIAADSAKREEEYRERARQRGIETLRTQPTRTAKGNLKKACVVCGEPVNKGQDYRMTYALRAHVDCL